MLEEKLKFAVFIDYDNIEIGVKSTLRRGFDVHCVLEGIKERGEVVTLAFGTEIYIHLVKQCGIREMLDDQRICVFKVCT